jgi:hypothetical protein
MLRPIDQYFSQKEEPIKSSMLALRKFVQNFHDDITEEWKYGMPFYCCYGKMFCYLWVHKKFNQPYIGIVEGKKLKHPKLVQEKRARMKILLIDPAKDLPVKTIRSILQEALGFTLEASQRRGGRRK